MKKKFFLINASVIPLRVRRKLQREREGGPICHYTVLITTSKWKSWHFFSGDSSTAGKFLSWQFTS